MIIYGRNAVHEALRAARRPLREIVATAAAAREHWLPAGARARRRPTRSSRGSPAAPRTRASAPTPGRTRTPTRHELLAESDPLIVVLDEIQDPQNLGAIVRTAEGAGATGVVIPERRSAEVTPAVCKASAGAVEWARVARVRNVADYLGEAKAAGCWCYGAAAGDGSVDYTDAGLDAAASCWCSAPRARACGRASRAPATRWCRCRCTGGSTRSTSARPPRRCLYGILQKRVDSES